MTKKQIIGAIMLATGKTVEEVAKEYGYSKHTFYRVINRDRTIPAVRELISAIVGLPVTRLWPDNADEINLATLSREEYLSLLLERTVHPGDAADQEAV